MLLSTTNEICGKTNKVTRGIVIGNCITEVNNENIEKYDEIVTIAIDRALRKISEKAENLGATAIVGITTDYKTINKGAKIIATAVGTAVIAE